MDPETHPNTSQQQSSSPYSRNLLAGNSAAAAAAAAAVATADASTPAAAAAATEGEHTNRRRWAGLAAAARVTDEMMSVKNDAAAVTGGGGGGGGVAAAGAAAGGGGGTTLDGDEIPAPHLRASHHPSGYTALDDTYTRDPARLQDENYANIFAHFLQTYRRDPGEVEDDDDENAAWPEDPVLEAQRPAGGGGSGTQNGGAGEGGGGAGSSTLAGGNGGAIGGTSIHTDTLYTHVLYTHTISTLSGGNGGGAAGGVDAIGEAYYMRAMANLLQDAHARRTLVVKLHDVERWQPQGAPVHDAGMRLAEHIRRNYIRIRCRLQDVFRLLMEKLAQQLLAAPLQYTFFLQLRDASPKYIHEIGTLRCHMLGRLLSVRGQVTRSTDVRPELLRASFKCLECGYIEHDVEQCFRYTQPRQCRNTTCNNTINWELLMERSQCGDWQKLRVQEPTGSSSGRKSTSSAVPRSIDLILRHDLVDTVYAGDVIIASGALIAIPDVAALLTKPGQLPRRDRPRRNEATLGVTPLRGLSSLGVREMQFKICMLVIDVQSEEQSAGGCGGPTRHDASAASAAADAREVYKAADFLGSGSFDWLREVAEAPNTLDRLVKSVAPRVWGYEDVKKGILLLMTGGVQKATANARLRGDINMCIVGDPSTSKSQLLAWVTSFAPRAVFASGKGSTAAGLTAAVVRDSDQGDYVLEAGALMYADQGICCIDEFDKMDEKDRVAIHEAMEQQTISISKAGIQVSFHLTEEAQRELQQARIDEERDNTVVPLSADELRLYIQCAQKLKPLLTDEAKVKLAKQYTALRLADAQPGMQQNTRITVRQLESLVRLSEAVARLKFSDFVREEHVDEAVRIFRSSLQRIVYSTDVILEEPQQQQQSSSGGGSGSGGDGGAAGATRVTGDGRSRPSTTSTAAAGGGGGDGGGDEEEMGAAGPTGRGRAGGGGGVIRMPQEEYRRISCQLIEYISRAEREAESSDTIFDGVRSSALIEWWLDEVLKADDPEALEGWAHKLMLLIRRLVAHDGYLVAEPIDGEGGGEDELLLRVHPNLSENFSDVTELHYYAAGGISSRAVLGGSRFPAATLSHHHSRASPPTGGGARAAAGAREGREEDNSPEAEEEEEEEARRAGRGGGGGGVRRVADRRSRQGRETESSGGIDRRTADNSNNNMDEDDEDDEMMVGADLPQEAFEQLEERFRPSQSQGDTF